MRFTVRKASAAVVASIALVTGVVAGAGTSQAAVDATAPAATPNPGGTITVSAAASLTDVMPVIAKAFEKRYPGTTVRFNFAGSNALVEQVLAGAPVDVLVTASEPTMWKAINAGAVTMPWLIAKNTMAIAMPPGNPANITSLQDLQRTDVTTAICAPAVPCGAAAKSLFALNGVTIKPVSLELDVRDVLGKVMADAVDAGIVYVTDVRAVGSKVTSVAIPADKNVTTTYPIAQVKEAPNPVGAKAFAEYVRFTPSAQGILRAWGFARAW